MISNICRELIQTIGRFMHPIKAQLFVENYCQRSEISLNEFMGEDISHFVLFMAKNRDEFLAIDDYTFNILLGTLVKISNREGECAIRGGFRTQGEFLEVA